MKLSGRFQVAALLAAGFMALLLLGGGLAACASGATSASASPPTYTESDEPESRKRATNRLKLAVLYFQDAKLNFALDEVKPASSRWPRPAFKRPCLSTRSPPTPCTTTAFCCAK